jgi:hypothetical protein
MDRFRPAGQRRKPLEDGLGGGIATVMDRVDRSTARPTAPTALRSGSAPADTISAMTARLTFDRLAVAMLFLAVLASACLMPMQNDSWWHLRVGQEIWRLRAPVYLDAFSFTVPGSVWRNHEWLTQLGFYGVHTLGGLPLLTFAAALLATSAWAVSWSLMAGPAAWRVVLVGLALPAAAVQWSVRPHLVTLCLVPLVLRCLLRGQWRWIPPMFLLWANLHAGFVAGLVVVGTAAAVLVAQDRSRWRALAATMVLSVLATLVNPLGIAIWTAAFEGVGRSASIGISEFRAASLLVPGDWPFWALALLLAALSIRQASRTTDWTNPNFPLVATSLVLMPTAVMYSRNIPLFVLLAVPAITQLLVMQHAGTMRVTSVRRERFALNVALLVALIVMAGGSVGYAWQVPAARLEWEPMSARTIDAVASCPGQVYNRYDDGGYLLWFVPSRRVFIDSRQDPYPLELLREHLRTENSGDYTGLFATYGIRCAFLPPESPIAANLRRDGWLPLSQDRRWIVLRAVDRR